MMRKGVPHAKCNPLCAIKDSLKALWDRAGNCINRINDVSPDGDGDFTITGGDNVIVSSDPNGITIDTTGAVAYYSSSDPKLSIDNSNLTIDTVNVASLNDVQTVANDLSTAESDILTLQGQTAIITGDLITETTQRQAADTTLQNNIDAVAASTAGLQGQIDLKRDRSDTVGYYAYTHNGVTQNETVIEDGTTAATIPVRDANGRMHAADPAAGATDKTLTTANWISQTGTGRPNNLIHDSGTETKNGRLDVITPSLTRVRPNGGKGPQNYANKFYKLFTINKGTIALVDFEVITNGGIMRCIYDMRSDGLSHAYVNIIGDRFIANKTVITTEKDNVYTAWLQNPQNRGLAITVKNLHNLFSNMTVYDIGDTRLNWIYDGTLENEPVAADYDSIKYSESFI